MDGDARCVVVDGWRIVRLLAGLLEVVEQPPRRADAREQRWVEEFLRADLHEHLQAIGPDLQGAAIKDANGAKAALDSGLGLSDVHRGDLDPHSFDANGLEEI